MFTSLPSKEKAHAIKRKHLLNIDFFVVVPG